LRGIEKKKNYVSTWLTPRVRAKLKEYPQVEQLLLAGDYLGINQSRVFQVFPVGTQRDTIFSEDEMRIYLEELKALARGLVVEVSSLSRCGFYTTSMLRSQPV
jgi:hypothetical protein